MIINPRIGQSVQVWYRADMRWMPYYGLVGTVKISSRGKPRNHGVEINGVMVVVPCGNIRKLKAAQEGGGDE